MGIGLPVREVSWLMEESERDLLIRMDEKMDAVLLWQTEHLQRCHETHKDHERRLRGMEEWKWKEAGVIAMCVFLWQGMGEWVIGLLRKK